MVLPTAPRKSVPPTFAKYGERLEPAPLAEPAPLQGRQFFAALVDPTKESCSWKSVEAAGPNRYRLSFRLPDLRWQEQLPYGGHGARTLTGLEASVFLDARYELERGASLTQAIVEACSGAPTLEWAKPHELWAAAQCHRARGEAVSAVLARVAARCGGLAAQALPAVKALSEISGRQRDGLPVPRRDLDSAHEKLRAVDPPSACFATDPLWSVDYTARSRPFALPKVALEAAWEERLSAMGSWPR